MTIYELFDQIASNRNPRDFRYLESKVSKDIYDQIDNKELFQLIVNIMSMCIEYRNKDASFKPAYTWQDGRKSFSIEDISDTNISSLETLDLMRLPSIVRAQICDVLWSVKKDYKQALIAADAYFGLFDETFDPENWIECVNMVSRAVILAAKLNDNIRLGRYMDHVFNCIFRLNGSDKLFFSTQMISLLINQKYKCDYNSLLPVVDNLIAGNKKNDIRLKEAYRVKADLYKKLGKVQDANETMIAYAEELVALEDQSEEKTFNDFAIAEKHYQEAITVLQNYGQNPDEVIKKLLAVQKNIFEGLSVKEFKLDNSENVKMINERYSAEYKECLKLLAIDVPWMEVEKTKQEVIKLINEHPLQNLFPKTNINRNGNIIAVIPTIDSTDPERDQEALLANMYSRAKENEDMYTNLALMQILSIIRNKEEFSEKSLDYIVNDNILIPEGREEIFKTGLYLGLSGKYYEALHILAPQVENLFRELAKTCGDTVIGFKDGIQQAITLGSIFDCDNLNLCYDENILFTFRGLMEKKEGSNIRNLIGHGLMESREVGYAGVYFICAVYKLLFYNSKNVLRVCSGKNNG